VYTAPAATTLVSKFTSIGVLEECGAWQVSQLAATGACICRSCSGNGLVLAFTTLKS
jgi:hypothetical protein